MTHKQLLDFEYKSISGMSYLKYKDKFIFRRVGFKVNLLGLNLWVKL